MECFSDHLDALIHLSDNTISLELIVSFDRDPCPFVRQNMACPVGQYKTVPRTVRDNTGMLWIEHNVRPARYDDDSRIIRILVCGYGWIDSDYDPRQVFRETYGRRQNRLPSNQQCAVGRFHLQEVSRHDGGSTP